MKRRPFDFLARHYNVMTGFPGRVDVLAGHIKPWVEEWSTRNALDAGCGGGALMLALDRLDVKPVGLDASEPMLRLALANSRSQNRRFEFCGSSYEMAGRIFPGRFDTVFCIGNSIIGASGEKEMVRWLTGLRNTLRPDGHLLLQLLNIRPFMLGLKTIIARRTIGDAEYVRAAVPDDDRLNFCALYLGPAGETQLHVSRWLPWDRKLIANCLASSGFQQIETFGSLERAPFDERASTDLVIAAKR